MKNLKTTLLNFACLVVVVILTATIFELAAFAQTQSPSTRQGSKTSLLGNLQSTFNPFQKQHSDNLFYNSKADTINAENRISPNIKSSNGVDSANSSQPQTTSEPGKNIVYFGGGTSREDDEHEILERLFGKYSDYNIAFTFGYLRVSNQSRLIGGADISYEGRMIDGTFGSYRTRGAFSFNGIVGVNVARKNNLRFDVAGLVGARERITYCPASRLGYACYANLQPDRSYSTNYGGIVTFSYRQFVIGARATGASTQGLLGIRF